MTAHFKRPRLLNSAKYLGVVLNQHLFWNNHVKQVASKATKVNAFLHKNLYQRHAIYS